MIRVLTFSVILLVSINLNECSYQNDDSNVQVSLVHNITQYLIENPDVKFEKMLKNVVKNASGKIQLNYTLGNRISGDRLVGEGSGSQQWGTAQDVKLTLTYPRSGTGAIVTFVYVPVEQSTNLGQGYVTSGGIGQRQITVIIEARQTFYFRYNAQIYGY